MINIILRLSRKHVLYKGYVNLRYEWDPGCPTRKDLVKKLENPLSSNEYLLLQWLWPLLRISSQVSGMVGLASRVLPFARLVSQLQNKRRWRKSYSEAENIVKVQVARALERGQDVRNWLAEAK
jgi:hypothetical protein